MRRRRVGQLTIRQDHWEPFEMVTIKGFTEEDMQWVQDMAVLMKDSELHVLSGTSRLATLVRGIVSWSLVDEQGQGLPWPALYDNRGNLIADNLDVRKRAVKSLMPEDAQFINDEIGKLNVPMSKEEQESFLDAVRTGSQAPSNQAQPSLLLSSTTS